METPGAGETADPAAAPVVAPAGGGRRLARATAIFSLATGLSRVLGLVREIVAKNAFGVQGPVNAFQIAFLLPNTVRALVADAALSSAFVPVFSDLLERGERRRAWRVASSLLWLTLLGLGALTALFMVVAPWVMRPLYPHDHDLLVGLSRVLFPIVALLGVSGIVVGILNTYDEFSIPALSPVAWNLAIVAGLAIGVPQADTTDGKLYVYAAAILVGTVIQVLLPLPWLRGRGGRLELVLDWRDPYVRRVFRLMLPVTLGLGLINVNALIDGVIAARLVDANIAPAAIDAAFRIYMLPQGMFSVAVATVLFPSLARFAARGDAAGFRDTVSLGLRQIAFLLVPASVVTAVLAEPITRLVYQRGAFEPAQTPVVAGALAAFAAGLTFNGAMLMLNRAFFSLQSNWIPTLVALGDLVLNGVLDVVLSPVGTWGIPLATSIVNVAGTAALLVLLRRRTGRVGFAAISSSFLRVAAASALAGAAAFAVWWPLDDAAGRALGGQLASVLPALAAAAVVYTAACRALEVREMQALLSLRGRLRRG
ncbi:MAG TPA: murein biosynthesis integral membrane protein MurJ [Gaiellaceae bacterium]|nr:murein biosynthesis integral membrane protein MurJ [Gaiellaceae bacterium]